MVVVVLGLRTSGQTLSTLTASLERLCSKEDRTWKERIFNQTKLVGTFFYLLFLLSESIDNPSMETILRRRYGTDSSPTDNDEEKTLDKIDHNEQPAPLPRIVLWGVTLTISGLAIYIWNHTQRTDPTTFISLGDFLAQLYGK